MTSTSPSPSLSPSLPSSFGSSCPPPPTNITFTYGTSGFRGHHSTLPSTCYRMGILSVLRSLSLFTPPPPTVQSDPFPPIVGVMVTASHNECHDNGMKIIDPSGEMMDEKWENIATKLANCAPNDIGNTVIQIVNKNKIPFKSVPFPLNTNVPIVFIGEDTRDSSPSLSQLVMNGVREMGGIPIHMGVVTTPQLHWITERANKVIDAEGLYQQLCGDRSKFNWFHSYFSYRVTMETYFHQVVNAFHNVIKLSKPTESSSSPSSSDISSPLPTLPPLILDCAYGVGALSSSTFLRTYDLSPSPSPLSSSLPISLINSDVKQTEKLNEKCGAEFVQKSKQFPFEINENNMKNYLGKKFASLDGDADRIVYYYLDPKSSPSEPKLLLLDGDKIITLFTTFFQNLISRCESLLSSFSISIGIVQTAYANGSSTHYITNTLKVPVVFTPTGVKYLHHEGKKYDIGIYFEANGHGTVLFSRRVQEKIGKIQREIHNKYETETEGQTKQKHQRQHENSRSHHPAAHLLSAEEKSILILSSCISLMNQSVGDAISDLLLVECALYYFQWDLDQWNSLYLDIPSTMLKVKVPDRNAVVTTDAERKCVQPDGLQREIDVLVRGSREEKDDKENRRRAFVRPSGTEDVVRVYAEAPTEKEAKELAHAVSDKVEKAFQK